MQSILHTPITILFIALSCIAYFFQQKDEYFTSKYAMFGMQVRRKEYYRLITGAFLHGGIYHLIVNMLALYNLGSSLELYLGHIRFLLCLLISIIGANLMVYFKERSTVMTVGMSGGIYGLMFIYFVILWSIGALANPGIRNSVLRTVIINGFISFMPGISMYGHLGGALTGIILGLLLMFI